MHISKKFNSNSVASIYNHIIDKNSTLNVDNFSLAYQLVTNSNLRRKEGFKPFQESDFIFLIADIQKNTKIYEQFKSDLELYTDGILKDVHIITEASE
jgi:hypothetical protein